MRTSPLHPLNPVFNHFENLTSLQLLFIMGKNMNLYMYYGCIWGCVCSGGVWWVIGVCRV